MQTLRTGCLAGILFLASSLGAQQPSSILTDSPPPPPPGSTQAPPPNSSAPRPPNGAVRISGGVMAGQLINRVAPVYPPTDAQGTVVLHAIIAREGTVQQLSVISGPPALQAAAVDAVKQWRYQPYLLNGEPVMVDTTITVNFRR
jgi:periplasmic protein TonB